jgi:hypothetical protein
MLAVSLDSPFLIGLSIFYNVHLQTHILLTSPKESRETANIEYTRRGKPKQQHNTICVGHHYAQTKTNKVEKHKSPFYCRSPFHINVGAFNNEYNSYQYASS